MERYTRTGQASVSFVYFAQAMHHRCYEQTTDETNLSYQSALQSASILCIDGIAMQIFDYMGQLLIHHRRPVCSTNINGTQFTPYILSRLTQDYSVRLIVTSVYDDAKGKPRAYLDHAISVLQTEIPGLHCLYTYQCSFYERPGTFDIDECGQAITHDKLLAHPKPPLYILLNTIGSPYQEIRTHKHQDFLANHSIIAMNVGGFLDRYTGFEKKAPARAVQARVLETLRRVRDNPPKNKKKFLMMFGIVRYWIGKVRAWF